MKRWHYYALIGLVFGIMDWVYLEWFPNSIGPTLGDNPLIVIPVIIGLNYGIWLLPIIPVVIFESKKATSIKGPIFAGILTWCCAIFSYYTYYAILLSLGKLIHLEGLNVFGEKPSGFWNEYIKMFNRIILWQFLAWIPIAIIGGGVIGALAWWIFHKHVKE